MDGNTEMKEYTGAHWCELIAWMINCDNQFVGFTDKTYTGEMIWKSNSHGELFGVMTAIEFVKSVLKDGQVMESWYNKMCYKILEGHKEPVSIKYAGTIGMRCMKSLWRMPPNFNDIINDVSKSL